MDIFNKHKNKFNWYCLSLNKHLPFELIDTYYDNLSNIKLALNKNLIYSKCLMNYLIEKCQNKINWHEFLYYHKLDEEFIEKYSHKIDWYSIAANSSLNMNMIKKYKHKLQISKLCENPNIDAEFIENIISYHKNQLISEIEIKQYFKDITLNNYKLTDEFIKKYIYNLDWYALSLNINLTPDIIEKFQDKLKLHNLCKNPSIIFDYIKNNIKSINSYKKYDLYVNTFLFNDVVYKRELNNYINKNKKKYLVY